MIVNYAKTVARGHRGHQKIADFQDLGGNVERVVRRVTCPAAEPRAPEESRPAEESRKRTLCQLSPVSARHWVLLGEWVGMSPFALRKDVLSRSERRRSVVS